MQYSKIFSTLFIYRALTLSGGVSVRCTGDQLFPAGTQGTERRKQFVQLQPSCPVLCQLFPDLIHLSCDGRRLPQALHRSLQGLQQWVHFIMELVSTKKGPIFRKLPTVLVVYTL